MTGWLGKFCDVLPKSKWGSKVTTIKEAQNLKMLALDDLPRKLLTHKIDLKEDEEEVPTKKGVTFKTTSKDFYSLEDQSSDKDEESMTMIVHRLKKMFKSNRFNRKKFYKRGLKRNERSSKCRKFCNNNESNIGPCFGCGLLGHVVKDCLIWQKKARRRKQKAKKEFKKPMLATSSTST